MAFGFGIVASPVVAFGTMRDGSIFTIAIWVRLAMVCGQAFSFYNYMIFQGISA